MSANIDNSYLAFVTYTILPIFFSMKCKRDEFNFSWPFFLDKKINRLFACCSCTFLLLSNPIFFSLHCYSGGDYYDYQAQV